MNFGIKLSFRTRFQSAPQFGVCEVINCFNMFGLQLEKQNIKLLFDPFSHKARARKIIVSNASLITQFFLLNLHEQFKCKFSRGNSSFSIYMYIRRDIPLHIILMGYTTPYCLHGIYHSILSSWDIPLHIILMHSIPYYPHGRITPPPLSKYSYILLLATETQTRLTSLSVNQYQ